ncbi:hypothetical protein VTN31DRAFT_7046 [Thermomyces dupontii]|uniref:uncharacterized protein n=1 Tax=Talaromyces thermophilus TaxID=28565 RepID=UPI003744A650
MEVDHCDNALVAGRAGFDIVSSLPLELVIPIVEYLDQADVLRCQRVSKRWHSIFSSNAIINAVLPNTLAALGLDTASIPSNANPMT